MRAERGGSPERGGGRSELAASSTELAESSTELAASSASAELAELAELAARRARGNRWGRPEPWRDDKLTSTKVQGFIGRVSSDSVPVRGSEPLF